MSFRKRVILITSALLMVIAISAQQSNYTVKLARLKYNGGGDWYLGHTSLKNLANFCNDNLDTQIDPEQVIVDVGSPDIFNYPFIFMTGHGNVFFSDKEASNLRIYLEAGGFLFINDSYGLDKYVRAEIKKVFPELDFVELPYDHKIYHQKYEFNSGLPKIHEHEGKSPQGFGLLYKGRLVCFYNFECDLGDGWEDHEVHKDPEQTRTKALKMGANVIQFVFSDN